jgi:LDH2 family malate/lactate/ureidoglycolate dehydrogenase
MQDFASILHDSPSVNPQQKVIVPGEIELQKMARQRREGIELDAATLALLQQHAVRPNA